MLDKVKTADAVDGLESEDQGSAVIDEPPSKSRRSLGWWRFVPKRLASRIVLLNLLGLVILVSGILYSNQFRQGLIDARVQSLTTQAQIIAAAVAGSATVDTGSIVIDPDELAGSTDDTLPDTDQVASVASAAHDRASR